MNRSSYWNLGIRLALVGLVASLCVGNAGCGTVHGTDGKTLTTLGIARWTEGQTLLESGIGKGMDTSLSHNRPNTFNGRSPAVGKMFDK